MPHDLKRISVVEASKRLLEIEKQNAKDGAEPMDPMIRPVVVALMAHGFPTAASCQGHLGSGLYPWVGFSIDVEDSTSETYAECLQTVHAHVAALNKLLGGFYESRKGAVIPWDRLLRVEGEGFDLDDTDDDIIKHTLAVQLKHNGEAKFPSWIGYSIQCNGAETLNLMPREILETREAKILERRQQDMQDFAKFLDSKL